MTKILKNLIVPFAMAISINALYAEKGGDHEKGDRGFFKKELIEKLNLSDKQKESFKALKKDSRSEMKDEWAKMKDARKALDAAFEKSASDEEIKKLFANLQDIERDFKKKKFEGLLEIRKILTPEQRIKFHAFMKEHRSGKSRE